MTSRSDKRRTTPSSTATTTLPLALPLPLPFPRPLGKPSHRRTQSSPNRQHTRTKSWLSNFLLSKPTTTTTTSSSTTTRTKDLVNSSTTTTTTGSSKGKTPLKDIINSRNDQTDSIPRVPNSSSGVYPKPRRPSIAILKDSSAEQEQQDLVKRLASWDWDGGEHLSFNDDSLESQRDATLEIIKPILSEGQGEGEGDQSLGTVWKGFLAETFEHDFRALSPTSTSPPLPPIPFPEQEQSGEGKEEEVEEEEISFLSLASAAVEDSSLAISTTSTSTSSVANVLLSNFPSPSGGEISFSDPFKFSNHLSSASTSTSTSTSTSSFVPPLPSPLLLQSLTKVRSPSQCSSTTTLAERRSKPVPSPLRIIIRERERSLPRKPSGATSIISESVYWKVDLSTNTSP
ncbi:hypothetical protein JCM3765_002618 [Sporobolomyces pararoseus]